MTADLAEFPYRLATGWITPTALISNDAYLLTAFPVQSDQPSIFLVPWGPPSDNGTSYPAPLRYGEYSDQTQWSDGGFVFQWTLAYVTELMLAYLYTTFWPLGIESNQVTVKTRMDSGEFAIFHCFANRPRRNQDYRRGYRGVEDLVIRFVSGVLVSDGLY